MNPTVSVIIPFLDSGRFIEEAIQSVLTQSYDDWELVLVDDGSRDQSPEIAAEYTRKFRERIRLLRSDKNRRGAAAARNRGIASAQGSLIAFLDADDLYTPDKLARDVAALDLDPAVAWVYGGTRWFFPDDPGRDWTERLGVALDRSYPPPDLLIRIIIEERGDIPCTCGVMIRKKFLGEVGGFEEGFTLYEDQSLWAKLLLRYPVRVVSGCHARYRQHGGSTTSAATLKGEYNLSRPFRARRAFLNWLMEYALERKAPESVLLALERALVESKGGHIAVYRRKLRRATRYLY